jgi:hypothetical protein
MARGPEADWQNTIVEVAHWCGWKIAHFRAAPRPSGGGYATAVAYDGAGFPDLVLVHHTHGVLFVELKAPAGRMSPAQQEWAHWLTSAGQHHYVWRPDDWAKAHAVLSHGPTKKDTGS